MNFFFCVSIVFLCGVVASNNIDGLLETNPAYQAEWWKVAAVVLIAVGQSIMTYIKYKA